MKAFTRRLGSGRLRSGKSGKAKNDAAVDPSYISVEPVSSDSAASLALENAALTAKLAASESQNANLRGVHPY